MEIKTTKSQPKGSADKKSVRVSIENQKRIKGILLVANKKKLGRAIKFDQLLSLALNLIQDEHIKLMQENSLSNANRRELYRQKYIEIHGPISEDEFTGFTFTVDFQSFLNEHFGAAKRRIPESENVARMV